jgi:pantothenate kinase
MGFTSADLSPFVEIKRADWSVLGAKHRPATNRKREVDQIRGLGDRTDITEVAEGLSAVEPASEPVTLAEAGSCTAPPQRF